MKLLKALLLILSSIIEMMCGVALSYGCAYFTLPLFKSTGLGLIISTKLTPTLTFGLTLCAGVLFVSLYILQKVFSSNLSSKIRNLFVHLSTWVICLTMCAISIYTFAVANPLLTTQIEITATRKITIGLSASMLIIFYIMSDKIMKVINRKIQSYETAKEMSQIGRSSVVWVNFLKLFEIIFPEMLVLLILSMCASWNISCYFVMIMVACIIPMLGNIDADFNLRSEIRRKQLENKE